MSKASEFYTQALKIENDLLRNKLKAADKIIRHISRFDDKWNDIGSGGYRKRDLDVMHSLIKHYHLERTL